MASAPTIGFATTSNSYITNPSSSSAALRMTSNTPMAAPQMYQSVPPPPQQPPMYTSSALNDTLSAASNLIKSAAGAVTLPPPQSQIASGVISSSTYPPMTQTPTNLMIHTSSAGGILSQPGDGAMTLETSLARPRVMADHLLGRPPITGSFIQGGSSYNPNYNQQNSSMMMDEASLYRPQNAELILPGRTLRGGMRPVYDTSLVRTFEAFPVFHPAVATAATGGQYQTAVHTTTGQALVGQVGMPMATAAQGSFTVLNRDVGGSELRSEQQQVEGSMVKSRGASVSLQQDMKKRAYVCC